MITLNTKYLDVASKEHIDWMYNGLDCCITLRLWDTLKEEAQKRGYPLKVYERALVLNDMSLDMTRKGIKINLDKVNALLHDKSFRHEVYEDSKSPLKEVPSLLNRIAALENMFLKLSECWGEPVNHRSSTQLKELFYGRMYLEPIYSFKQGERKISVDREALLKLKEYDRARPFCEILLRLRDLEKLVAVMTTDLDSDHRLRSSFKVAGTETGRFSSSSNAYNTGTNGQNITKEIREAFEADLGYSFVYIDLEQAEARIVAYISNDPDYIRACLSGDLHTEVSKLIWPNLAWTSNAKENRKLAEQIYYRHFSRRDLTKRAGHGTNYVLKPHSLGRHLKIHLSEATKFQTTYYGGEVPLKTAVRWEWVWPDGRPRLEELAGTYEFINDPDEPYILFKGAFPGIRAWHDDVATQLQSKGWLENPMGRRRYFWGDTRGDDVLRKGVAYLPQSTIGDALNEGLKKIYMKFYLEGRDKNIHIVSQVHDAGLFLVKTELLDKYIPVLLDLIKVPMTINGHDVVIPAKAEFGPNWKDLKEWTTQ